jgi:hypothetical protein
MSVSHYIAVSKSAKEKLRNAAVKRDKCLLMLATIFIFGNMRPDKANDGFITIHSAHLKYLFGNSYRREVVEPLVDLGMIECNGSYLVESYSMAYRILPPYLADIEKTVISDKTLIAKLQRLQDKNCRKRGLINDYTLKNLRRLSLDKAIEEDFALQTDPRFTGDVKRKIERDIYHWSLDPRKRELYSKVSRTNGRLNTNFTSTSKNVRNYLSVDGQPLCLIDVKNSQPLCAIRLYYSYAPDTPATSDERERFIEAVTAKGEDCFYSRIFWHVHNRGFENREEERPLCKERVLTALYDAPLHGFSNPYWQAVKALFPILGHIMEKIKYDAKHFNELAIILQRLESTIFVDNIIKKFAAEESDFFLLGTHDGLCFIDTEENRERLKSIVIRECRRFIGVTPVITFDELERKPQWEFKDKPKHKTKDKEKERQKKLSLKCRKQIIFSPLATCRN